VKPAFPIDIVLPWVDGDDPKHIRNRNQFCTDYGETSREDVGGVSRFQSLGEIRYCIESINLHARFVRKIFIVTDGQDPDLDGYMKEKFPQGHIPMEIVDHKVIFRDYESYLPVFNSRAIETIIWRIPDLSEHFILMNDDFMFIGDVTEEDFFKDGSVVCYGTRRLTGWAELMSIFRPHSKGHKRISFKESMINAAGIMGRRHTYLYLGHTPRALKRSFFEAFFSQREDVMRRNINYRFRDRHQFNSQELFYICEDRKGKCITMSVSKNLLYLKPKRRKGYIDRKIQRLDKKSGALFCCINTLCLASDTDRKKVLGWVERKLYQNRLKPE